MYNVQYIVQYIYSFALKINSTLFDVVLRAIKTVLSFPGNSDIYTDQFQSIQNDFFSWDVGCNILKLRRDGRGGYILPTLS